MAKKNKTDVIVVSPEPKTDAALVPMPSSDLLLAGVTNFSLSKDDLLDLLVSEAEEELDEQIKLAERALEVVQTARAALEKEYNDSIQAEYLTVFADVVKSAKKLFPTDVETAVKVTLMEDGTLLLTVHAFHQLPAAPQMSRSRYPAGYQPIYTDCELVRFEKNMGKFSLTRPAPAGIGKSSEAKCELIRQAQRDEHEAKKVLQALNRERLNLKHSTKKLRVQLIRKVLASNPKGSDVLGNVRLLSKQFLTSLKKDAATAYAD